MATAAGREPRELAVEFMRRLPVGSSWPAAFTSWATGLGLSQELQRLVRVEIIRRRVFRSVEAAVGRRGRWA